MLSYEEARAAIRAAVAGPLAAVASARDDALGLVLAEDVASNGDVPPFDNSAMDGYAVRATDLAGAGPERPVRLRVIGELPAGTPAGRALEPGTAIRIMTGAPLPEGADTIVRVEDTTAADGDNEVLVGRAAAAGADLRRAGEDVRAGQVVLPAGRPIGPAEIGALASVGRTTVQVRPRPRVGVVTTGSELVAAGSRPGPGQIRDANGPALAAQVRLAGGTPQLWPRIPDQPAALRAALEHALAESDLVVVSGGVSVGEHDHVKSVLAAIGAELLFWRVRQKPGGPLALWRGLAGRLVFGLPGNPVSSLLCFEEHVRPALRKLAGQTLLYRPERRAALADDFRKRDRDRLHLARVRLAEAADGTLEARLTGPQGSGILSSMVWADGLALIPEEATELAAGAPVTVHLTGLPEDH